MAKKIFGMKFKSLFYLLLVCIGIVLVFTFVDFWAHHLYEYNILPENYFLNKTLVAPLIGFVAYLFIRKQPLMWRAIIFSAAIAILLQSRYLITGYPLDFVFIFMGVHFLILWPVSYYAFKWFEKWL
jgi:hypothetical protein